MRILKEHSRQEFKERFTTKQGCNEFFAGLKWLDGYACKCCDATAYIKGK